MSDLVRWTRQEPCPVCDGWEGDRRGQGLRCFGFLGGDGKYAHCTREELAGGLVEEAEGQTFAHRMGRRGCKCGSVHGNGDARAKPSVWDFGERWKVGSGDKKSTDRREKPAAGNCMVFGDLAGLVGHYELVGAGGLDYVTHYIYEDERGEPALAVFRFEGEVEGERKKTFRQGTPVSDSGRWQTGVPKGAALYPYRLLELQAAVGEGDIIYIVEGEKDVDAMHEAGHSATCNPMGAGKPLGEFLPHFDGSRRVIVVADNDDPGKKHAGRWTTELEARGAVDRVEYALPAHGCKDMSEVIDLDAGFSHVEVQSGWVRQEDVSVPGPATERTSAERTIREEPLRQPPAPRFALTRMSQIRPSVSSRGLVKGWLTIDGFSVIYGPPGASKTFLTLDLTMSVAAGRSWLGQKTTPGFAIYVACEGGSQLANRVWAKRERDLAYLGDDLQFVVLTVPVDLLDRDGEVDELIGTAREMALEITGSKDGCSVITFDTLSQSTPGGSENSPEDMTAAVGNVNRIRRELECAAIVVHHSGKDATKGARGHSSLQAAVDTELEVAAMSAGYFQVRATKQRDMPVGAPLNYRLVPFELGVDEDGDMVTTCTVELVGGGEVPGEKKGKSRLAGRQAILMKCLEALISENRGAVVSESVREKHHGEIPAGILAVQVEELQEAFLARLAEEPGDTEKRRKTALQTFRRTIETAQAGGHIELFEKVAWAL